MTSASVKFCQVEACAMVKTASKTEILLARLVVVLLIAFTAIGVFWYGFSEEVRHRVWQQLIDRPTGPMAFRFILQPAMAMIAALRDGIPAGPRQLLREYLDQGRLGIKSGQGFYDDYGDSADENRR